MRLSLRFFFSVLALLAAAAPISSPASAGSEADSPAKASGQSRKPSAARAAAAPAPRPAIWLLADEDTRIYLFGTVHVLPPGFRWRSPALDRIVAEADELVVETYDAPGKAEHVEARNAFLLPAPVPILARVPSERRAALKEAIRETGVPIVHFDRMRTWAAGMALGLAQLLGSYGADDADQAPGVEDVLEKDFRAAGKPISSVEDPADVVASLNALPEKVQVALLLDAIGPGKPVAGSSAMEDRLWARGDVEGLASDVMKDFPPALFDPLLRRRNRAWSAWLAERLERPGTILFAVGAGHLAGRESVQRMLAERGLIVRRVN